MIIKMVDTSEAPWNLYMIESHQNHQFFKELKLVF